MAGQDRARRILGFEMAETIREEVRLSRYSHGAG
jgi:hypothetical protein